MSKTLGIIGAGHLGLQIAHFAVSDEHYDNVVFFDDFSNKASAGEFTILGTTAEVLPEFQKNSFDELLIGIGYKHLDARKSFYESFMGKIPFGKMVHSTCWVDPTAKIGSGAILYPGCCIDAHVEISENTILNLNCTISHDSIIGAHSFLAPRVAVAGFVNSGEKCFFGINTTISDNISIISATSSGAAALIIKDIIESGLYIGHPAQKKIQ